MYSCPQCGVGSPTCPNCQSNGWGSQPTDSTSPVSGMFDDKSHRYVPAIVVTFRGSAPATGFRYYPPGQHPVNSPIVKDIGLVEVQSPVGSRWYGCDRAYINSELRMVMVGHNSRDEVRARWKKVPVDLTDGKE
jgi:hypothetical protein